MGFPLTEQRPAILMETSKSICSTVLFSGPSVKHSKRLRRKVFRINTSSSSPLCSFDVVNSDKFFSVRIIFLVKKMQCRLFNSLLAVRNEAGTVAKISPEEQDWPTSR
ncbi:hypothetical protein GJ496_002166 [Pomphorhynchus laevis]|nr:hypothetical protein GJ496_002166 [Pomphorhynchus laevis]